MDPFLLFQQMMQACSNDDAALTTLIESLGLTTPEISTGTAADGRPIRTASTGIRIGPGTGIDPQNLFLPISTWKLRLIPRAADNPAESFIPITLICHTDDGTFRELQVDLLRFELESDPNDLIAADLHVDPHTHLTPTKTPTGQPIPVRLLGPGLKLKLTGMALGDIDFEFTGAAGSSDPDFPSARFEPPHFIINQNVIDTEIGVVCDEVLVDLKRDADPAIVQQVFPESAGSFRGFFLKDLGVFIGDGAEVGTWSGMAAMRNFFIEINPGKLTGTFAAELVHFVLENDPQVQVRIFFQNEDGIEVEVADAGDAQVGAPTGKRDYVRVRLEAKPNWDSAGFDVSWQVPVEVPVEEPGRLTNLNLGWVKAPPGDHSFTVVISDHRVETQTETRRVIVFEPSPAATADPEDPPFTAVFDGVPDDEGFPEGQLPTNRLHLTLRPEQKAKITARVFGDPDAVVARLGEEPDNFFDLLSSKPSPDPALFPNDPPNTIQALEHLPNSKKYELAEWVIQAPNAAELATFSEPHAVLTLRVDGEVQENGVTVVKSLTRRLRVSVAEGRTDNHRDFELVNFSDWRDDPGIGQARVQLFNGLNFGDIQWVLENEPVDLSLFSTADKDGLFKALVDAAGSPFSQREEVILANSAGAVRPFLHTDDRLWRLIGRVPADPAATAAVTPEIIGEPKDSPARCDPVVAEFLLGETLSEAEARARCSSALNVEEYIRLDRSSVHAITFHYDCALIMPPDADHSDGPDPDSPGTNLPQHTRFGPEHDPAYQAKYPGVRQISFADTTTEQVEGLAALFRAIEEDGPKIAAIGLFGAASEEGDVGHNLKLSRRRAAAVHEALLSPSAELVAAMENLPDEHERYTLTQETRDRIAALESAGAIVTHAFGERHADTIVNYADRRVFAIFKLNDGTSDADIVHLEYFVTLPGAPAEQVDDQIFRRRKLQKHPFRHAIFRFARVEVELLRNELIRLMVLLKLDLEKFNENDVLPGGDLNTLDGLMTFFFEMIRNPNPQPGQPRFSWELAALSDPGDVDGITLSRTPGLMTDVVGPPAVVLPPLTALSGGRTGITGFVASVFVGALLTEVGALNVQTFIWRGVRGRILHGNFSGSIISAAFDYTVQYHIDADLGAVLPGLPRLQTQPDKPITISFRNVGIEYRRGSDNVEFFYDPDSGFQLEVNDPGVFRLGDGIGRLLNVNNFRTGAGSPLWFEVELALALETGIFSIDTLRIRVSLETEQLYAAQDGVVNLGGDDLSFSDFDVTLNKLGVSVNVPGTLQGRGELGIRQDTFEGQIDVNLVPLDLRLYGALKVQSQGDFRAVFAALGVDFAPGIPLGTTGAAVYGFHGLVGVNMARNETDALKWFQEPTVGVSDPNTKWQIAQGSWAFGVGTVVGTAFDNGFSFNTKGAFLLEIPGPKFLLATMSDFLKGKPGVTDNKKGTLISVVMLDFENDLLLIGIDFTYSEKDLLTFRVPTEVFFNLQDASDWHIRFGQWEPESKRISLRLLNYFDAQGYFVLEGDGSKISAPLNLSGVSLATGARIELFWGSRTFGLYLEAYVEYHVGLQISPIYLEGTLEVGGELHLVVASIGAKGKLTVKAPDPFVIKGEVCGKLGFWRFKVTKCIPFEVGDGSAATPDPAAPFKQMVVIDRMTSAAVEDEDAAPLDAVLHLVFDQDMIDARPAGEQGINVSDMGQPRNQVSSDLFYEYHLESVRLLRVADNSEFDLEQSAWGAYSLPLENGGGNGAVSKADATRTLRVLDWLPHAHPRALDFQGGYGEQIKGQIQRLCDPTPPPERGCVTFDEEPLGANGLWRLDQGSLAPVTAISGQGSGPGLEFLSAKKGFSSAAVVPLPAVLYDGRVPKQHALRLPGVPREQRRPLQDLLPQIEAVLQPGFGPHFHKIWPAGLLFLRLPALVQMDLTFVVPAELPIDGEVIVLDALLQPLTPILSLQAAPVVSGSTGSGQFATHLARRLAFGPPDDNDDDPPRAAWVVINPPGREKIGNRDSFSYLNEICGITFGDWRRWREREGNKTLVLGTIEELGGLIGGAPGELQQELLEPNTTYRIEGSIHWQRFRDKNSPDDDGNGDFNLSTTFRTASRSPTEIGRYIHDHEPQDDRQPHYYEEPVQIRFASNTVDHIFARFGEQLVARAKADTGTHAVNQPMSSIGGLTREFFPYDSYEEAFLNALQDLDVDCRPGNFGFLFPKPVYSFPEPLLPNTRYTVSLIPRPLGEPAGLRAEEWERILQRDFEQNRFVFRFDIRTSRWATFSDHVAEYHSAAVGDLFADDEQALDQALSAITNDRADDAVDALCLALFGGPMAIPGLPQVMRLWVPTGPPPDPFSTPPLRCRGILLDGPEPLLKRQADGRLRVRLQVSGVQPGGLRIISGIRGARVFILFDQPAPPTAVQIELQNRPGGNLPPVAETLVVNVGASPGSFGED